MSLTQLVELAAYVNEHVAGARLQLTAATYRESFVLAAECGLIDGDLRDALLPSVGVRNVLRAAERGVGQVDRAGMSQANDDSSTHRSNSAWSPETSRVSAAARR